MNVYDITLRSKIEGQLIKRGLVAENEKEARKKIKKYRKHEKCSEAYIIKIEKQELEEVKGHV